MDYRVDDAFDGERKGVDDGDSDKLNDLAGEEVFEEAMEPQEHFHDLGSTGSALVSASVNETLDAAPEIDDFEEAISEVIAGESEKKGEGETEVIAGESEKQSEPERETGVSAGESEKQGEGETEVIADQELERDGPGLDIVHLNEVDSGDGLFSSDSNGVQVDNFNSSDLSGGNEESGLSTGEEVVAKEKGATIDGNSGLLSENAEIDDSDFMTPRENGDVVLENGNTDRVDYVVTETNLKSKSNEVVANQGAVAEDSKDGDSDPEFRDQKIEEVHDISADCNGGFEHQGEVISDMKDGTPVTDFSNEDRNDGDMTISDSQITECIDRGNDDAKNASESEQLEAIREIRTSSDLHETVEERDVILPAVNSSFSENSADEIPSIQTSAADLKVGSNKDNQSHISEEIHRDRDNSSVVEERDVILPAVNSSFSENSAYEIPSIQTSAADLKVGSNKDNQSHISEEIHRDPDNSSVVEEPEKIQEKHVVVKESTKVTKELKIQPATQLRSASEKSASAIPPPVRPAGLGHAAPLLEPASRVVQQSRANSAVSNSQSQQVEDSSNGEADEYDETREKLQMIRVKFLRLAHRLGQTPHNVVVAQVLYRLGLAEQLRGRNGGRVGAFSFDRASAMAEQLEAAGQDPLDFSCTIMVLGKTGVGKSSTINSIFDEVKFNTSAFHMGTNKVQDVVGTVQGIKVRVIDTPGLLPSWTDQRSNEKILHSVKRFIKKTPPDIVLYLDRLDMQSRDFSDMPLLHTITDIFGPSIWFNAIVVLTHAASAPPDGPNGTASSYDMFVTQRSHVVQQAIRQAAGDMRLMNPVSLVENHSACRTNRAGQRVLPNGQVWKPHLLLLSFASKVLSEANALLKLQDSLPGKPYTARSRPPPLPYLLSSLLQSRPQLKLPDEQFGDDDSPDDDLVESSDSDDETEVDDLPPFKPLTKAQVHKLSKAQKKAYFDELEYREKLLMMKQLKEEKKRRKMMKKMAEAAKTLPSDYSGNMDEESSGAASVPVPMPDLALPSSFDADNPTHRYRYLDSSNQWLVRPVLETHGWDHDVGYEGLNVERLFVVKDKIPLSFSGQVSKDKKDANVQMEIASSVKHGEGKATSLGFDMQTVGKDLAYTLRSETRFSNFRRNKTAAGLSFTLLGDALSAGLKIEDKLVASNRFKLVFSGGAMAGRGDVAYGGSLEAQLRDKDYPLGRSLSTLGLSVMDWHGDLAVGCNVQSQIPIGRHSNLVARANLNNRGAGQISIRLNSSEQLQIALIGLIPLIKKLVLYPQQVQFGQ
ncbi:PREDICTED: translocase of chloroplast 120, chloroplastic-like isoform X2 [Lupinus angustifolius]|uniref:translocase of chloroplast 120, chloroplastic-like isoform X2 n=1 Tax=Lupinus angustifolius TaxID=3871 RepID=UPI00092E739A|nr:PREDICTED: translocase of chloroplast 120, chloroplastic-like isoform X2 [Lupinus angustifolius]